MRLTILPEQVNSGATGMVTEAGRKIGGGRVDRGRMKEGGFVSIREGAGDESGVVGF